MSNNINQTDKNALIKFIKTSDKFTNSKKVKIFEINKNTIKYLILIYFYGKIFLWVLLQIQNYPADCFLNSVYIVLELIGDDLKITQI